MSENEWVQLQCEMALHDRCLAIATKHGCDNLQSLGLAREVVEVFAKNYTDNYEYNRQRCKQLIKHFRQYVKQF